MAGEKKKLRPLMRSSSLVEAVLGYSLITFINIYLFPGDLAFLDARVHPYWIVILLLASRYGFSAGFSSGLIAAVLYLGGALLQEPEMDFFTYANLDRWLLPLLFLSTGCILGEIRQVQIREYSELDRDFQDLKHNHSALEKQYDVLRQAKLEVDSRIISQEQTLSTLYDAAQGLQSLEEKDIYPATLNLLHEYLGVTACSVYEKEEDVLQCVRFLGEPEHDTRKTQLPLDDPFVGRALRERRTISVNQALPDESARPDALIASPIMNAGHDKVIGALVVEGMPFLKLTNNSVRMVSMLADWCGASLTNARAHQDVKAKLIIDEIIQCYTWDYLQERLEQEFLRSRRYKVDISLLMIQLPELPQGYTDKDEEKLLIAFSLSVREKIRKVDLLFLTNVERRFVLLLPNTPLAGAKVVGANMVEKFTSLYSQPELQGLPPLSLAFSVISLNDTQHEFTDMLAQAEAELEQQEGAAQ